MNFFNKKKFLKKLNNLREHYERHKTLLGLIDQHGPEEAQNRIRAHDAVARLTGQTMGMEVSYHPTQGFHVSGEPIDPHDVYDAIREHPLLQNIISGVLGTKKQTKPPKRKLTRAEQFRKPTETPIPPKEKTPPKIRQPKTDLESARSLMSGLSRGRYEEKVEEELEDGSTVQRMEIRYHPSSQSQRDEAMRSIEGSHGRLIRHIIAQQEVHPSSHEDVYQQALTRIFKHAHKFEGYSDAISRTREKDGKKFSPVPGEKHLTKFIGYHTRKAVEDHARASTRKYMANIGEDDDPTGGSPVTHEDLIPHVQNYINTHAKPHHRRILELSWFEGLKPKEIRTKLGEPKETESTEPSSPKEIPSIESIRTVLSRHTRGDTKAKIKGIKSHLEELDQEDPENLLSSKISAASKMSGPTRELSKRTVVPVEQRTPVSVSKQSDFVVDFDPTVQWSSRQNRIYHKDGSAVPDFQQERAKRIARITQNTVALGGAPRFETLVKWQPHHLIWAENNLKQELRGQKVESGPPGSGHHFQDFLHAALAAMHSENPIPKGSQARRKSGSTPKDVKKKVAKKKVAKKKVARRQPQNEHRNYLKSFSYYLSEVL